MAEDQNIPFSTTDVAAPEIQTDDPGFSQINRGTFGSLKATPTGFRGGDVRGDAQIGVNATKNLCFFYVGDFDDQIVRMGNLNGIGGFTSDTYGIFIGDLAANRYLSYDSVSGELIVNGRTFTEDPNFGDGSDGNVTLTSNTTLTTDFFPNELVVDGCELFLNGWRVIAKVKIWAINGARIHVDGTDGADGGDGGVGGGGGGGSAGAAPAATTGNPSGSLFGSLDGVAGLAGLVGGGIGSNSANGAAGNDGDDATVGLLQQGANGKAGAQGGGGAGTTAGTPGVAGNPGTFTASTASVRTLVNAMSMVDTGASPPAQYETSSAAGGTGQSTGGGGGGAAGGGGSGASGSNGSNAGIGLLASPEIYVDATSTIGGKGGDGGDGGDGGAGGVAAGGGGPGNGGQGGDGGWFTIVATVFTMDGTWDLTKGVGGSPGTPGAGDIGGGGSNGATGVSGNNGTDGDYLVLLLN